MKVLSLKTCFLIVREQLLEFLCLGCLSMKGKTEILIPPHHIGDILYNNLLESKHLSKRKMNQYKCSGECERECLTKWLLERFQLTQRFVQTFILHICIVLQTFFSSSLLSKLHICYSYNLLNNQAL